MSMALIERPSPNHNDRPSRLAVDMLLLHYTGMPSAEAALDRLCDPAAQVSAHYLIDEEGQVFQLVQEERRAWHAGVAEWAGERDINGCSVGIELVNPGHEFGYRDFPEAQMAALERLCHEILARHTIPPQRVLGHSDVAPLRKQDPGERFDWKRLALAGIGLWTEPAAGRDGPSDLEGATAALRRIGYGFVDEDPAAVLSAFQRHFRPARFDGVLDAETAARLSALLARLDETLPEA